MLNVRLDQELDKKLKQYSMEEDLPKSTIVKEALAMYFSSKENSRKPYSLGADLFGLEGSGNAEASTSYKKKIKEKLNEKHAH